MPVWWFWKEAIDPNLGHEFETQHWILSGNININLLKIEQSPNLYKGSYEITTLLRAELSKNYLWYEAKEKEKRCRKKLL